MSSFSGLGIGLSLVFGCLVLALVAELYYLLWWKKKRVQLQQQQQEEEFSTKYAKELFHLICWKKPNSQETQFEEQDLELGGSKDLLIKAFNGDESIESELMRLHNLSGPPRFLFTIKEETKEDLESEDGKSTRKGSRTTSLSDLMLAVDSPLGSYHHHHGFNNPLFESSSSSSSTTAVMESEMNRIRSSPPPKFKFLRDAEEKLFRKLMEESERRELRNCIDENSVKVSESKRRMVTAETEGSFLGFIVGKSKENSIFNQVPAPATSSQVLPLASSPTTFRPFEKKPNF
ncbi:uncharacterized protein [Euphorbia lathyris]|uniref:uncharacterized protein n=1 Tax=Euphorbia lathyris TaxID=212925 RepID=UPI00331448E6